MYHDEETLSEHRAMMRREFPAERLPNIRNAAGNISLAAIATHLSARGTPNASPAVVKVLLQHGVASHYALALAGLAQNIADVAPCTFEDRVGAVLSSLKREHAEKYPNGACAVEFAAQREAARNPVSS